MEATLRELAQQGLSYQQIATELNDLGVKTLRGRAWKEMTVGRMLCRFNIAYEKSDRYYGRMEWHLLDLLDQGLTYPQIASKLTRLGYRTVRGRDFTNKTVHRIIKRLSLGKQTYDQWCREHLQLIQSSLTKGMHTYQIARVFNEREITTRFGGKIYDVYIGRIICRFNLKRGGIPYKSDKLRAINCKLGVRFEREPAAKVYDEFMQEYGGLIKTMRSNGSSYSEIAGYLVDPEKPGFRLPLWASVAEPDQPAFGSTVCRRLTDALHAPTNGAKPVYVSFFRDKKT